MIQILTLNEAGYPLGWSTWQDAVSYKSKGAVVWETGEIDITKFGGYSRITGDRSKVTVSSIMALRGGHRPTRLHPPLTNQNLFGRDLHICAYCGNQFFPHQLTNDHIVPRSRGGKHVWTNCVTSCKRCNNAKGDYMLEDTDLKLLYVPYAPSREEALIMRNRNILADQMQFLQAMIPEYSRLKMH